MNRITISSSIKFKETIEATIDELEKYNVAAVFFNLNTEVERDEMDLDFMKKLERDHFESIDKSDALYVICPSGYVGTSVSVEIGYAHARGKPIIFSEKPDDLGLQALASQYIRINDLEDIKSL